jgi:hypothetical protein
MRLRSAVWGGALGHAGALCARDRPIRNASCLRQRVSTILAGGYHVLQASEGADLDFLVGKSGAFVPRDNH